MWGRKMGGTVEEKEIVINVVNLGVSEVRKNLLTEIQLLVTT